MRMIGSVPPIMFIKDYSAAQLARVQQILQTADFGPDYVPTVDQAPATENKEPRYVEERKQSLQQKIDELSRQFSEEGFSVSVRQGPGDTLEVVCDDRRTQQQDNTHCDQTSVGQSEQSGRQLDQSNEPLNDEANLNLRSDIYDLDHRAILNQVMISKNRTKDRNYRRSDSEFSVPTQDSSGGKQDSRDVVKALESYRKKGKKGKMLDNQGYTYIHGKRNLGPKELRRLGDYSLESPVYHYYRDEDSE